MSEELDEDAKELKRLKNFLSFYAKHLGQLYARVPDLQRDKQLNLLNEASGFVAALDTSRVKNPTPTLKREFEKLKHTQGRIIDALREHPISVAAHGLIVELAKESSEKIAALEKHIEKMLEAIKDKKRGYAAKENSWLDELDNRPDWMEGAPRGNRIDWKVPADAIEAELMQLGYVQYDKALDKEKPPNAIPTTRTINTTRKNKKNLGS